MVIDWDVNFSVGIQAATLIVWSGGIPRPKTGATQYRAHFELQTKVVGLSAIVECLNFRNGLAIWLYYERILNLL